MAPFTMSSLRFARFLRRILQADYKWFYVPDPERRIFQTRHDHAVVNPLNGVDDAFPEAMKS